MKKFISVALVLVFVLSLFAGCGSKTPASTQPATSAAPQGGTGTIKIGVLGCTSGDYAQYGNAVIHGAQLYIDKVNAAGGINGKKIEYIIYDDKGDPTEAVNAYNRLVGNGITALLGSVLSGATAAVVGEANPTNMPMITASATDAGVTYNADKKLVYKNVFRTCYIDPFQGQKMADYASQKLNAKTAAIIFETGNDYAVGLKNAFIAKAKANGITVVAETAYSKGDKDFKSQLTNIKAKNPDVIFCPNYYEDDGMIVTQARQLGIKSVFMGGDGWANVYKYASAADLEGSIFCSSYAPGSTDEIKKFEADFKAKYPNETPNMFSAQGYDAAIVLLDAIKAAESKNLKVGSAEYKQAIIDGMKNTTSVGLGGKYKFDEYNNPIKNAVIIKLQGGAEKFSEVF